MSTAFFEISVGIYRNPRLNFRDGFDGDVCFLDEIIKPSRSYGVAACVDHNCGYNKISRA